MIRDSAVTALLQRRLSADASITRALRRCSSAYAVRE
jgi:hypothetical protein